MSAAKIRIFSFLNYRENKTEKWKWDKKKTRPEDFEHTDYFGYEKKIEKIVYATVLQVQVQ